MIRSISLSLMLLVMVAACGDMSTGMTPGGGGPGGGQPDGGSATLTFIPPPNDVLMLGQTGYNRDGNGVVTTVTLIVDPQIVVGSSPGQGWFVFPGMCPLLSPGEESAIATIPYWETAVKASAFLPLSIPPTVTSLGLYEDVQLPVYTCFNFADCDTCGSGVGNCNLNNPICGFKPYQITWN